MPAILYTTSVAFTLLTIWTKIITLKNQVSFISDNLLNPFFEPKHTEKALSRVISDYIKENTSNNDHLSVFKVRDTCYETLVI